MARETKLTLEHTLAEISKFHFILDEGRKGHHLLFDPKIIRLAFSRNQEELMHLFEDKLERINFVLNRSFEMKSFEEKRAYLSTLPTDLQCALVFGYFQLLEGQVEGDLAIERTVH